MRWDLGLVALIAGCALPEPADLPGSDLAMLSVSQDQGCGLSDEGLVYCWGAGTDSAYAALPRLFALGPVRLSQVVATGTGICGVLRGGGVACAVDRDSPLTPVTGEPEFTRLVAGEFVCGETATTEIWCWNKTGGPATKVADAGVLHGLTVGGVGCALDANDHAVCWTAPSPEVASWPTVDTIAFQKIASMLVWSCGQALNGDVYCWSTSSTGVIGTVSKVPTTFIHDGTGWADIYGSGGYLGLISDGGGAYYYQAPGHTVTYPESGQYEWQSLSVGSLHVCGVLADGRAACFGQNSKGQLGNGTWTNSVTAVLVGGGTP